MIYKNGYTSNSYQLSSIIHAAMLEAGWEMVSDNAGGEDEYSVDKVFYSPGEDGYQNIYVRVAAGLSDIVSHGNIQYPFSDGYTEYVNLFAYQYYPDNGYPESGVNEIGRFGPAWYVNDVTSNIRMHSLYSNSNSPLTVVSSPYAYYNWSRYSRELTDGGRYLFYNMYWDATNSDRYLGWMDLARPIGFPYYPDFQGSVMFYSLGYGQRAVYSRRAANEKFIWALEDARNGSGYPGWSHYNIDNGTTYYWYCGSTSSYLPPWGTNNSGFGWLIQGVRRNKKRYLYAARGENTTTWARWDMDNLTWTSMSPATPANIYYGSYAIYIMKEITGYTYDRIYVAAGNGTGFYSIAIDDNGDPTGSWTTHAVMPFSVTQNGCAVITCPGGDKLIATYPGTSSAWAWTFPTSPTGTGSWSGISVTGLSSNVDGTYNRVTSYALQHHLLSRVRVEEQSLTRYWVFVNKNRVVVVTFPAESTSGCNFAYAGYFKPYADGPTTIIEMVDSTHFVVADITKFKVGASYKIVNMGPGTSFTTHYGKTVQRSLGEVVSIVAVDYVESVITTSATTQTYTEGALIGEEVQPVGVFLSGREELQVLNSTNTDGFINSNPVFQTYKLGTPYSFYSQNLCERVDGTTTWPIVLTQASFSNYRYGEIRGELDGVLSGYSSLTNGSTYTRDGKTYIKFSLYNSYRLGTIFVGPLEE